MIRLVADTGWYMLGVVTNVGSWVAAVWSRSCTKRRAWSRFVPDLNSIVIAAGGGTDSERMIWTFGTPLSAFSSGTATNDATSEVDSPCAWACTRTWTRANQGKTSSL